MSLEKLIIMPKYKFMKSNTFLIGISNRLLKIINNPPFRYIKLKNIWMFAYEFAPMLFNQIYFQLIRANMNKLYCKTAIQDDYQ